MLQRKIGAILTALVLAGFASSALAQQAQAIIGWGKSTTPKDIQQWLRPIDYPADALMRGLQGSVTASFDIAANGTVSNCAVAKSSGHKSLDAVPCRLLSRRARFQPSIEADGVAMAAKGEVTVRFRVLG